MCRGIRWTSLGGFLPQRNSDMYILEIFTKRQTHTHVSERHQHKKKTPSTELHKIQLKLRVIVPIISEKENASISWDFQSSYQPPAASTALTEAWVCLCAAPLPSLPLICFVALLAKQRGLGVLREDRTGNAWLPWSLPSPHSETAHPASLHKLLGGHLKTDAQKSEENESPKSSDFLSLIHLMLLTLRWAYDKVEEVGLWESIRAGDWRWGSLCLDVVPLPGSPLAGEEIKWSPGGREGDNPAASSD